MVCCGTAISSERSPGFRQASVLNVSPSASWSVMLVATGDHATGQAHYL